MELHEIGQRLYNVLWRANCNNNHQPISVSIDYVMHEINFGAKNIISREQVVSLILNDSFRQIDASGTEIKQTSIFDKIYENEVLVAVKLPEEPFKHPKLWGL